MRTEIGTLEYLVLRTACDLGQCI